MIRLAVPSQFVLGTVCVVENIRKLYFQQGELYSLIDLVDLLLVYNALLRLILFLDMFIIFLWFLLIKKCCSITYYMGIFTMNRHRMELPSMAATMIMVFLGLLVANSCFQGTCSRWLHYCYGHRSEGSRICPGFREAFSWGPPMTLDKLHSC